MGDATACAQIERSWLSTPTRGRTFLLLPPPLKFGDPESIARRGLKPKRSRKSRAAYLNPERTSRTATRYAPIWQRIEGEWKRYRCRDCNSAAFIVIEEEGPFVSVRCAVGHDGNVLSGFAMTKPDG